MNNLTYCKSPLCNVADMHDKKGCCQLKQIIIFVCFLQRNWGTTWNREMWTTFKNILIMFIPFHTFLYSKQNVGKGYCLSKCFHFAIAIAIVAFCAMSHGNAVTKNNICHNCQCQFQLIRYRTDKNVYHQQIVKQWGPQCYHNGHVKNNLFQHCNVNFIPRHIINCLSHPHWHDKKIPFCYVASDYGN